MIIIATIGTPGDAITVLSPPIALEDPPPPVFSLAHLPVDPPFLDNCLRPPIDTILKDGRPERSATPYSRGHF